MNKSVASLTSDIAGVVTKMENGEEIRCAYANSVSDRERLVANEPEEIVTEIMAIWGDAPTVENTVIEPIDPEPTAEERLASLEEKNEMLTACILEMSEIVYGG